MNATPRFLPSAVTGLAVAIVFVACPPAMFAAAKPKNPTSKLYVSEVEGVSDINTGERIVDLTNKSVHSADGSVIETKENSKNAMVLSNGTGVFIDPSTRLEVQRFMQEPFTPNRNDPEVEPSLSQTLCSLPHGTVGLCTSKMVAGSTMVYNTPQANVVIRGRKVVIATDGDETVVSSLEGDMTVRGDQTSGGETIKAGQQAVIRRTSPNSPPSITIQPIPDAQKQGLNDKVDAACQARQKVFFAPTDPKNMFTDGDGPPQEIIVKEIVKPTLDPVITVSAQAIPPPVN